jgi:hypothetical protein
MQRDMRQDELIYKDANTMDLLKANIVIVIVTEDIMVTSDQDLTTIKSANQMQILLVDNNVT